VHGASIGGGGGGAGVPRPHDLTEGDLRTVLRALHECAPRTTQSNALQAIQEALSRGKPSMAALLEQFDEQRHGSDRTHRRALSGWASVRAGPLGSIPGRPLLKLIDRRELPAVRGGEHPDARDEDTGNTALVWACLYGRAAAAELLLDGGASTGALNWQSASALHAAAGGGHLSCTALLLERRADADTRDDHGLTPLAVATERGHTEVVQLLRRHLGTHPRLDGATARALEDEAERAGEARRRAQAQHAATMGASGKPPMILEGSVEGVLPQETYQATHPHWSELAVARAARVPAGPAAGQRDDVSADAEDDVSAFLAWIRSACLRHCVHGASIGRSALAGAAACGRHDAGCHALRPAAAAEGTAAG
jgi:hypothetical protein